MTLPRISVLLEPASEPLLKRVPSRDENGKPLGDLMILVPGLRKQPRHEIAQTIQKIHDALAQFADAVVFAEFNVSKNLLWVSVRPTAGIRLQIAGAIQQHVPHAKLVAHL